MQPLELLIVETTEQKQTFTKNNDYEKNKTLIVNIADE